MILEILCWNYGTFRTSLLITIENCYYYSKLLNYTVFLLPIVNSIRNSREKRKFRIFRIISQFLFEAFSFLLHPSYNMVFPGESYYNIYRIMLTVIGLWPYQSSIVVQVQTSFFLSAYSSFLFFQVFCGHISLTFYLCDLSVLIAKD